MLDRDAEIEAFKRVNLTTIAADLGWRIIPKKSTRHSVLMERGGEKIIVSKNGRSGHFTYCSVTNGGSSGTVIDFVQNEVERGASLGRVRQVCRPFLSGGYVAQVEHKLGRNVVKDLRPSEVDLASVAARFSRYVPIAGLHEYLCDERGVPADLLTSKRLTGRVFACPHRETVIFPHYGSPDGQSSDRCLTGFEIKAQGLSMFAKGGRKSLFVSNAFATDRQLVIAESGLDAISYLAVRGDRGTRVLSTAGKLNPTQPELIKSAVQRLGRGEVIAAADNDKAGDDLSETLEKVVRDANAEVTFRVDRPQKRGADWNDVARESERARGLAVNPALSLSR